MKNDSTKNRPQALTPAEVKRHLKTFPLWARKGKQIQREFTFKNYYETMAFVNALAWVSHQTNHHPDLAVRYGSCVVTYTTHDAGGLSVRDFVCAALADSLMAH